MTGFFITTYSVSRTYPSVNSFCCEVMNLITQTKENTACDQHQVP